MPATLTAEDFGGESSVPMQKIKDIVLDKYTALKDVKTDFCYMENVPVAGTEKTENLIQVLVYMQGKGAFFPTFDSRQEAEVFLDEGSGDAAVSVLVMSLERCREFRQEHLYSIRIKR